MTGREEPPSSEGGSHWRVAEKGMRSATLGLSGTVGISVSKVTVHMQILYNKYIPILS